MGEHQRPKRSQRSGRRLAGVIARRAAIGSLWGLALAAAALLAGAVGLALFLFSGGSMRLGWGDLRPIAFYVTGFAVAGSLVGALWPATRTFVGRYALGVFAALIVFAAIATADRGSMSSWQRADWYGVAALGVLFGLVAGHGFKSA